MNSSQLFSLLIAIPAFVAALTVHEFAHAFVANRLGDPTAQRLGRLTLDPMKHLDPLGSLMFLVSALAGIAFGWAKPVPFDPRFFKHPRRDAMLVAIAGPISNLLQVPIWLGMVALLARLAPGGPEMFLATLFSSLMGSGFDPSPFGILGVLIMRGVIVNLTLAAFNMIPLPPLDGHFVLEFFGGEPVVRAFDAIRPFSFIILIVLINLPAPYNFLSSVLGPVYLFGINLVAFAVTGQWGAL